MDNEKVGVILLFAYFILVILDVMGNFFGFVPLVGPFLKGGLEVFLEIIAGIVVIMIYRRSS